jgi:hypothetical protein
MKFKDDPAALKIILKCMIFPIMIGIVCYPCSVSLAEPGTLVAMQQSTFVYMFGLMVGGGGTAAAFLIYERIRKLRKEIHAKEIASGERFE